MTTLLLDPNEWDLMLDANGNIAIADAPYAVAQDVASECLLWQGEARYDKSLGVPYADFLGELPTPARIIQAYKKAAEGVPNVENVKVIIQFENRKLGGQIQFNYNGDNYGINI